MGLDEGEFDFKSIGVGSLLTLIAGMLCMRGTGSGGSKKKDSREKCVIIAGESGSGKTAMLYF